MSRLQEKAMAMNSGQGIAFMENREKGDVHDLYGSIVDVNDYDFINGDDGPYIVFTIKQDEENFFFGASVMTEHFQSFDNEDKAEIKKDGLPILLSEKKNKKGNRVYQNVEFYPAPF